jgi:hypothetical protein
MFIKRIEGWWISGVAFYGCIDNGKGHKAGKHYWGGRTTILGNIGGNITSQRGARDGRSTTKGDGDGEAWSGSCNEEKMHNP